jgi:hypothetical protein
MMIDVRVQALCDEFSVEIVPKDRYPRTGQTRAVNTIRKMIESHGEDDGRIVFRTLTETENNKNSLESETIGATLDLLIACRRHYEADPERWFKVWDACPVPGLQAVAHDLRGVVPVRHALAGLVYERIWRAYGPLSVEPDLFDERRRRAA